MVSPSVQLPVISGVVSLLSGAPATAGAVGAPGTAVSTAEVSFALGLVLPAASVSVTSALMVPVVGMFAVGIATVAVPAVISAGVSTCSTGAPVPVVTVTLSPTTAFAGKPTVTFTPAVRSASEIVPSPPSSIATFVGASGAVVSIVTGVAVLAGDMFPAGSVAVMVTL